MDVFELRIGNLLMADIGLVKVESILGGTYRVYCHSIDEEYLADYPIKDIKPIPLTKEWLLSFEIYEIQTESDRYGYQNGYYRLTESFFISIKDEFEIVMLDYNFGYETFISKCKYVHQLQNIYFALTTKVLVDVRFYI